METCCGCIFVLFIASFVIGLIGAVISGIIELITGLFAFIISILPYIIGVVVVIGILSIIIGLLSSSNNETKEEKIDNKKTDYDLKNVEEAEIISEKPKKQNKSQNMIEYKNSNSINMSKRGEDAVLVEGTKKDINDKKVIALAKERIKKSIKERDQNLIKKETSEINNKKSQDKIIFNKSSICEVKMNNLVYFPEDYVGKIIKIQDYPFTKKSDYTEFYNTVFSIKSFHDLIIFGADLIVNNLKYNDVKNVYAILLERKRTQNIKYAIILLSMDISGKTKKVGKSYAKNLIACEFLTKEEAKLLSEITLKDIN